MPWLLILSVLLVACGSDKSPQPMDCDADGDGVCDVDDCAANDPEVGPDQAEIPYDGADNDCDSATPDDDLDGDGFRASVDCDDGYSEVHPGADEICDGIDNNCDGEIDGASAIDAVTAYTDADGDGFGDNSTGILTCTPGADTSLVGEDCDDTDAASYPGAEEIWYDGRDEDCDGSDDQDQDGDGYDIGDGDSEDCDDLNAEINPGVTETACDGVDEDCDDADLDYRLSVAPPGSSWKATYQTLQDAINNRYDGDEICVAPGTYTEHIDYLGKALSIIGGAGAKETILDGGGSGVVVSLTDVTGGGALQGFTLTNGECGLDLSEASASLQDLIVRGNTSSGGTGAGLYLSGSTVSASDLLIEDNAANTGAGVYLGNASQLTLTRSTLQGNMASQGAGFNISRSAVILDGVRLWGNTAQRGSAIYAGVSSLTATHLDVRGNADTDGGWITMDSGSATFTNAIFACNESTNGFGAGLFLQASAGGVTNAVFAANRSDADASALYAFNYSPLALTNTSFVDNVTLDGVTVVLSDYGTDPAWCHTDGNDPSDFSDTSISPGPTTYITGEPGFADYDSTADCTTWDFALTETSALVDAGSPDLTDADRSTSDIGAYGGPLGADWPTSWPE